MSNQKQEVLSKLIDHAKKVGEEKNTNSLEYAADWIVKLQDHMSPYHEEGCCAKFGTQYRCRCGLRDRKDDPDFGLQWTGVEIF